MARVRHGLLVFFLPFVLCFSRCAYGQQSHPSDLQFAGCYEVTSLSWNPPDSSIRAIPPRFKLTSEHHVLPMPSKAGEASWGSWEDSGGNLKLSFGFLGGFRGSLKPSDAREFRGKLKEHCDNRCEWRKRVGKIRVRNIACVD